MEETATVTIKRLPSKLATRKFDVWLDGKRKIGIENNETQRLDVEPGKHTLEISARWIKTAEVSFTAEHKNDISFVCGYHGRRVVLLIVCAFILTFAFDLAVKLHAIDLPSTNRLLIKLSLWVNYFIIISRPNVILFLRQSGA